MITGSGSIWAIAVTLAYTNAHSKSLKHHVAMQAIFVAFYNFCRKHETLKGSAPAQAAGLTDAAWNIRQLLEAAAIALWTRRIYWIAKGEAVTKIVTLEVDVKLSKRMDDKTVTECVDHMLEIGRAEILNNAIGWSQPTVVDPEIAIECVSMSVSDSAVVSSVDSVDSSKKRCGAKAHEATKD
jgi:hypothetical protein